MRRTHLTIDDHGVGIALARSKGAQDHTVFVPIIRNPTSRFDPLAALETWLDDLDRRFDDDEQGIWLRISRGDNIVTPTTPISGDAINNVVIRRSSPPDWLTQRATRRTACAPGSSPKPRTVRSTKPTS